MRIGEKIWIGTFILLWFIVSTVSTIHSVQFFNLSNDSKFLSWSLAIAFEIGAMASLGGILISRGSKTLVWVLFVVLTLFQVHGNMYWSWTNAKEITEWINLFWLDEEELIFSKRIFAFISGGILPLVSLGFIKSLMDYMKVEDKEEVEDIVDEDIEETTQEEIEEVEDVIQEEIEETTQEDTIEEETIEEVEEPKKDRSNDLSKLIDSAENTVNTIGKK